MISNSDATPSGGLFGLFGGGKQTSSVQLGNKDDKTTLVACKVLKSDEGQAKLAAQSNQKSFGFFQRYVTIKNGEDYIDINIASFAKHLGISRQALFEFTKAGVSIFENLKKIKTCAPNFLTADFLKTLEFVKKNKDTIIDKMKPHIQTTYIRPNEANGLPRAIQINQDGQVFIHFNKKKREIKF